MTGRCSLPVLVAGLSLLTLVSCAHRPPAVPLDPGSVTAVNLMTMLQSRSSQLQTLEGSGTVSFDSPEFAGTAAFDLSLRKPDSLLVVLEGPFGIDIGSLFLGGGEYIAFNASENRIVTGDSRSSTMRSIIPFDLTFAEVLDAFTGSFRIPEPGAEVLTYIVDDGRFLMQVRCGSQTCSYWIDPHNVQVTRMEITGAQGNLIAEGTFSSFVEEGEVAAARRISVWFPPDQRQISIVYASLTINPDSPSFEYAVPDDATVVRHR